MPDAESVPAYGSYGSKRRREKRELMPGYGQTSVQSKCIEPPRNVEDYLYNYCTYYRRYLYNNLNYRTRILDFNSAVYDRNTIQVLNIQSYVDNDVVSIKVLYRLVYWTTQLLTWLLIPFLSAYVQGSCSNNSYYMSHKSKVFCF